MTIPQCAFRASLVAQELMQNSTFLSLFQQLFNRAIFQFALHEVLLVFVRIALNKMSYAAT